MQKQIRLLTMIRIIRMFLITMPVIVLYWQDNGLTMKDIFILQVVFSIGVVLFEIPSGYFADKYGRKTSMILGSILGAVGFFLYWALPTYGGFLLAEIILALSSGFMSGARDALLYETLQKYKQEMLHTMYQGRLFAIGNISEATAAILASIMISMSNVNTILLIQWIVILISVPMSFALAEFPYKKDTHTPTLLKILRGNFKENRMLRFLNVYTAGISAATLTMVWFAQPYWKNIGVDILYFGYLWAGLNILVAIGAVVVHRVEKKISFRVLFASMAALPLLLYTGLSIANNVFIILILTAGFWLLRGVSQPIIMDYIQRESPDGQRATVISINQLGTRLVFSIFSPFLGWVADVWTFQTAFAASGVIFGILALVGFVFLYREIISNDKQRV